MRPDSFSLNPYEVLGVPTNASTGEIRAAYRQHALRWHPDRNANDEYAMRMMQRVNAAWDILRDEHSRAAYDRWERREANTASGPDAWEQPASGPPPGGEWYRPPPPQSNLDCPRCPTVNESGSLYCYSCGFPLDEAQPQQSQSTSDYAPQYDISENSQDGRPAGFWIRLIAFVVDNVILFVLALVIASGLGISVADWWTETTTSEALCYFGAFDWINLALGVTYFSVLVAAWSTTLGKLLFGLTVVRNDGSKIGIGRAFVRYLLYTISLFIFGIGFLMIAFRRDKRGLHDLICDTKVVYQ